MPSAAAILRAGLFLQLAKVHRARVNSFKCRHGTEWHALPLPLPLFLALSSAVGVCRMCVRPAHLVACRPVKALLCRRRCAAAATLEPAKGSESNSRQQTEETVTRRTRPRWPARPPRALSPLELVVFSSSAADLRARSPPAAVGQRHQRRRQHQHSLASGVSGGMQARGRGRVGGASDMVGWQSAGHAAAIPAQRCSGWAGRQCSQWRARRGNRRQTTEGGRQRNRRTNDQRPRWQATGGQRRRTSAERLAAPSADLIFSSARLSFLVGK